MNPEQAIEFSMESPREKLVSIIESRVNLIDGDLRTYIWLRSDGRDILEKEKLGGGNFLMLMAELSVLNYLAKIHVILKKGSKAFKKGSNTEIVELDAFKRFVRDSQLPLGIDKTNEHQLDRLWKGMRNMLSHMATVADNRHAQTYIYDSVPYDQAKDLFGELAPPFTLNEEKHLVCNVDRLRLTLLLYKAEMISTIQEASDGNINTALAWIETMEHEESIDTVTGEIR